MRKLARMWSVLALAGTFLSSAALASPIGGAPQKLPAVKADTVFYESFENADTAARKWKVVDNNNDGKTWTFGIGGTTPSSASLMYGYSNVKANDYAFSPLFDLKADRTYRLSYFANKLYYDEDVEIWIGRDRTVEGMSLRIDSLHVTDHLNGYSPSKVFKVSADGPYCVGVRAVSSPNRLPGLYVDNILVVEEILSSAPAAVQNLVQVPGANGTGMQLKWKNPSLNEAGESLASLTGIEIYKNYGDVPMAYTLSLAPGAEVTWTDPDPKPGKVTYHVYAVNASGRSYAAVVNTFVGEDLPSAPQNVTATVSGSNVTLTWDEPSDFGRNGGWYNKSNLTYLVTRKPNYKVVASSATEKTAIDAVTDMAYYYYEVSARNAKGTGAVAVSAGVKAGTSVELPYYEEFEDEEAFRAMWSIQDLNNDRCTWMRETARGNLRPGAAWYNWLTGRSDRYDNNFTAPAANDWLFSPLMRFEKGKKYRLSYALKGVMFSDVHLRISFGKTASPQAMNKLIENVSTSGTSEFENRSVEFEVEETGSFCIGFLDHTDKDYVWIDDLRVEEIAANDLTVAKFAGSHYPKAGEENSYVVTVENKGTSAARNYTVRLLDQEGNQLDVSAEQTRPLASGRNTEISLKWTPSNTNVTYLRADITYAEDAVSKNNISDPMAVQVQGDGFKALQVGDGDIRSYAVPWYVYNKGFGQTVYPASSMEGMVGKIHALSYQVMVGFGSGEDLEGQHFRIWMGESDRYDMSAGWFSSKELTCVFDSTVTIENGCYDWYLPLQHVYDYRGGNLVVCIEGRNTYGNLGGTGMFFRCTESGMNAAHRSIYGYQYVSMDDEQMDNLVGRFFSLRPNTTFFFDVNGMGSLHGKVSDKNNQALADVRVAVNGLNVIKRTDAAGNYAFPYVPVGSNTVNFTKVGYEDQSLPASVTAGQTATLNVTMQNRPQIKVSGVIAGSDDPHKGLPLAELTLDGPSDYKVVTDENGCYTIENVYGNLTYTARITASGYSDYAGDFEVGAVELKADTIVLSKMVNMPSSVRAFDRTDYALVEWTDPVPVAWLQLDQGSIYGSFGGASDQAYVVGHRYTPELLTANGITSSSAITKVRFWPDAVATFTLQVYAGEKGTESLLREEAIKIDQFGSWFEYELQRPVPIDPAKNYIVALKVQQSSGSNPVGFDRGPAVENGDLFSSDNGRSWMPVSSVSPTMNYNWLIHTYCSANPNVLPTEPDELLSVLPSAGMPGFLTEYGSSVTGTLPEVAAADPGKNNSPFSGTVNIFSRAKRKALASAAKVENSAGAAYTYEVYRLLNGQEQQTDAWTKITEEPVAEMRLRDLGWPLLQDTLWRYAVRSLSDGAYSDYTFSRAVDKGRYVDVRMEVLTNIGEKAQGALVTIAGLNNVYTATVGANDSAVLENVHFGTYNITVAKENFVTYRAAAVLIDTLHYELGTVRLTEDVRPPLSFKAVDWVDYVDLSWEKPRRLKEVELSKTQSDFASGYGANAGGNMPVGQRFTSKELQDAEVDGFYINSISFVPAASADFTLKVWKSDNEGEEKEAYSQVVDGSSLVMEEWNTIVLDEPVLVNANQSYIIGYDAYMAAGNYPVAADNGSNVTGGDMLFYQNSWSSFCSFAPTMYDFNWMIRATVSNSQGMVKHLTKAEEELDYTYEVYRMKGSEQATPSAWSRLSGDNFKELEYRDNTWKDQPDGDYLYAVFSRSTTGNTSDTVYSENLPKGQVAVVTVKATTNNGTSAQGAVVRLTGEKTYSDVLGTDGTVAIPAVAKGSYALEIEKPHFEKLSKTVAISEAKVTLDGNELKESLDEPIVRAFKRDGENVYVNWYSPMTTEAYPHYITWSTDEFFTGIGQQNTGFVASCAHKYTPADLRDNNVVGSYIYKIKFYPASQQNVPTQGTFRVAIWEGDEGAVVLEQAVPAASIRYNEWNEVVLNKPYLIDGTKTILVGYSANLTQGWGCGIDRGPAVRGRGNMINVDGSWAHITDLSPDLDYNWMIQAYCTDALEAGMENAKNAKADAEDFVKSYSVYRLREADMTVPDRWTALKENTTDKSLQDNLETLPDAWYMYAVKAIYATGESEYAFSGRLGKGVANEELEEMPMETLVVMPNPNSGRFSMNLPFSGKVMVYAIDGSLVWQAEKAAGNSEFDLPLPAGNYVVSLVGSDRRAAGRLTIVK